MIKYLKRYWFFAILAPLFMIGEVAMDLIQPQMMKIIVDDGVLGLSNGNVGDLSIVISTGLKMIGLVFLGGLSGVLSGVFASMCSQKVGNDLRKDCFSNIMSLSFEQTDKFSTGSLITRVTNDITQVQNLVAMSIRGFVRTFLLFGGGIYCMLTLDLSFGVVIACALPIVICMIVFFLYKVNPFFALLQKRLDTVNSVMQENVSGARVIKAYVREAYERKRFEKANKELIQTQLHILTVLSYMTPLLNIVLSISIVAVIYIGSIQVKAGSVTPGIVMAAITYISQILNAVMRMVMIFQTVSRGNASNKRVMEVIKCDPTIKDGNCDTVSGEGVIEFKNVSFSYPNSNNKQVLKNINLKINAGETLAILGATGCGKSTFVNLIPRFYDVTEGEILVDGVNVKDYKLEKLREKIAITLQNSELFTTTIKENIRWGNIEATDEMIEKASDIAQAKEFIESKATKYETIVAERGMSLSGGQKQRLSIARAIVKNAEILILDDATSALDLKTEANLYKQLKCNYKKLTKIIVAQRVASVRNADRIAIIEDGNIVACDTHDNLLKTSAIYQDIYNSQLKMGGDVSYGE